MKVNFDYVLVDLDGKDIEEPSTGAVTLKAVCLRALTTPLEEDRNVTGETAFKRLELARKVNKGGAQEIDAADAVSIRERTAKIYNIVVSGQVYELLK